MSFTSAMTGIMDCFSQRLTNHNPDLSLPVSEGWRTAVNSELSESMNSGNRATKQPDCPFLMKP